MEWHSALAQQLEPRAYTNVPVGFNFLLVGYTHSQGDVLFDPSVPIENASAKIDSLLLGYSRGVDFWGKSGSIAVLAPYARVNASGDIGEQSTSVTRDGWGDPMLRLAVNLYGAPALRPEEFRGYQQDTIVGASLVVSAPWGEYDSSKLVNIGTNRWSFRPELGVSKALGPWIVEGMFSVTFFTENDDFFGGHTRKQDPLYAAQAHVIYTINPTLWGALDATYYAGGRTSVDGVLNNDLQQNSRWGGTLAQSLDAHNSIKLYFSTGATARTGSKFDTIGAAWQYRWL
jgi:hypothetical protein